MNSSINERVNLPPARKPEQKTEVNLISVHVRDLLNVRRLQGRLTPRQAAALLNCREHDIAVLVQHGLLSYLGNPPPYTQKYCSPVEVLELAGDPKRWGRSVMCFTDIGTTRTLPKPKEPIRKVCPRMG